MEITVTKSKNGAVYSSGIHTPLGRLSYPHLFERGAPYKGKGKGKYEATLYIPKKLDISQLKDTANRVGLLAFGSEWVGLDKLENLCIKDGDTHKDSNAKGCWIVRAKSDNKPGVVGPNPKVNLDEEEIYGGCWAKLSIVVGSYGEVNDQGVSFYLNNVQKCKDDERFGGQGVSPEDDFEAYEEAASSSDNF